MARKSKLSAQQRQEVVVMRRRREVPATALARWYGVSEHTLYKWREQFLEGGRGALANGKGVSDAGSRRIQELERELGWSAS